MTLWRKDTGADKFKDILEILALEQGIKFDDYYTYSHYPQPFNFMKYPVLQKGWKTQYEEMVQTVKEEYREDLFEEALIGKLNYWASYNLRYHNGKDIRKRFREAYNIMYYFERESDFLA